MFIIIYKSNLEELIEEASFAVYATVQKVIQNQWLSTRIVLSAWNYEDQPIQLHIEIGNALASDEERCAAINEQAFQSLDAMKLKIKAAELEVRDGVFSTVDKPIMGAIA
jgi:hypothetical protein